MNYLKVLPALAAVTAGILVAAAWNGCKRDRTPVNAVVTSRPESATGPTTAEVLAKPDRPDVPTVDPAKFLEAIPDLGTAVEKKLVGGDENWWVYDDGLAYQIMKPGKPDGAMPKFGQMVIVKYVGSFPGTKKVFDQSTSFPFQLGSKGIIRGWSLALSTMQVGEQRRFYIPAELGYGRQGNLPTIQPNQPLNFEITLASFSGTPLPIPKAATAPATSFGPPAPPASQPTTAPTTGPR